MSRLSDVAPSDRARAAAAWLARSRSQSMSDAEYGELEDWLADPENDREFALAEQIWNRGEAIVEAAPATPARPAIRPWLFAGGGIVAALAASMAWIAIVGLPVSDAYAAAKGERRQVTLADASLVELNADTRLTTSFNRLGRSVAFQEGEAFFQVSPDARRPFVVRTGDVRLTALGTRFNVRARDADRICVDVLEGRVQIDGNGWRRVLAAGQQIVIEGERLSIGAADEARVEGWREGEIVLRATPLTMVVEELNLYASRPIAVRDRALGGRLVSGRFESEHTDETLAALGLALSLHPVQQADGSVLLVDGAPQN